MTGRQLLDALVFFAAMVVGIACICIGMLTEGPLQ